MPAISVSHFSIFSHITFPIDTGFPAYTVIKGVETQVVGSFVVARRALNTNPLMNAIGWLELIDQGLQVKARADRPFIETLYKYIEDYGFTGNNYRNIKTNPLWREVYAISKDAVYHWNKKTNATQYPQIDFGYCLGTCGYRLPLCVLTIDHQRAQSQSGSLEVLMRMFRGMGLTLGAPAGIKNKKVLNKWAANVGGNTNLNRSVDKDDQNTLSMQGVLYYSIFRKLNVIGELNTIAMHHFLNLRPMCGPCNSARGNNATIVY